MRFRHTNRWPFGSFLDGQRHRADVVGWLARQVEATVPWSTLAQVETPCALLAVLGLLGPVPAGVCQALGRAAWEWRAVCVVVRTEPDWATEFQPWPWEAARQAAAGVAGPPQVEGGYSLAPPAP